MENRKGQSGLPVSQWETERSWMGGEQFKTGQLHCLDTDGFTQLHHKPAHTNKRSWYFTHWSLFNIVLFSALEQTHYTSHDFQCVLGYFKCFIIHQILTWTTWSLTVTCIGDLFGKPDADWLNTTSWHELIHMLTCLDNDWFTHHLPWHWPIDPFCLSCCRMATTSLAISQLLRM